MPSSGPEKNKDQPPARVCLAKITGAHGIRGLVKLFPYGEDTSLLNGTLFTSETGEETITVKLKNAVGKFILAEIEGAADRNAAEALSGTMLYSGMEALPPIAEKDTYYHADLVGLKVLNEQDEEIGCVIAVENYGAGDLLEIRPSSGQSYYVPFLKSNFPEITKTFLRLIDAQNWNA